jgi:ankyrin repeat protein
LFLKCVQMRLRKSSSPRRSPRKSPHAKAVVQNNRAREVSPYKPLADYARSGCNEEIESLLQSDMTLTHARNPDNGHTAFHEAARAGQLDSLKLLLYYESDHLALTIPFNQNSLHLVASHKGDKKKHLACAKLLISLGVPINAQDKVGNTPLHVAASCGNDSIIELLLTNGANPKTKNGNKRYNTALWSASKGGNAASVVMLGLEKYHHIDLKDSKTWGEDRGGVTVQQAKSTGEKYQGFKT